MKYAVVCAGGPEVAELKGFCKEETIFIGADRGAFHLLEKGIIPAEAVGDFDSVSKEEYEVIKESVQIVDRFRSEKDETDTELAVTRALSYGPQFVILTGVTGGRLDHTEAALHLLYRLQVENPTIIFSIRNETNELSILLPKTYEFKQQERYPYVSFFPFGGKVTGLSLTGFKYETINEILETGMTKFTSNEVVSCVCTVRFLEGICLMIRSSDG